jgi:hypothetical protein
MGTSGGFFPVLAVFTSPLSRSQAIGYLVHLHAHTCSLTDPPRVACGGFGRFRDRDGQDCLTLAGAVA